MQIVAPDLIGHGAAPDWDKTRDIHDQATEAAATWLDGAPRLVIGHSLGATIALRLAIERPAQIGQLVLIEPVLFCAAGDGAGRRATSAMDGPLAPLLAAGNTDEATRKFLSVWGETGFDALKPAQQTYMRDRISLITAQSATLNEDRAGLVPRLGQAQCPTLLIEGSKSPPVISEIMSALETLMPQTRRVVIDGAAHMVPITHAGAVAEEIARFLRD